MISSWIEVYLSSHDNKLNNYWVRFACRFKTRLRIWMDKELQVFNLSNRCPIHVFLILRDFWNIFLDDQRKVEYAIKIAIIIKCHQKSNKFLENVIFSYILKILSADVLFLRCNKFYFLFGSKRRDSIFAIYQHNQRVSQRVT